MKKSNKVTSKKPSLNIKTIAVLAVILFASFIIYRLLLSKPLVAGVLDDYQYNTQKVIVTNDTKTNKPKVVVVQQRAGDNSVGVDIKSDVEVAQNGANLIREKAIKKAVEEGKSQEEAKVIGNQAAENSLHTSSAQIAAGMASQLAIKNNLSEEARAAMAANAYKQVENALSNINLSNLSTGIGSVINTNSGVGGSTARGDGSSCGGKEAGIGDKQWAMLGDGTNKCVQCGGSRADGKGGPGVWGDQQVECGQGAATNYVAPIYQADKPKSCWKDGVWYADTAGSVGSEKCLNGEWMDRAKYISEKQKQCAGMGQGYYYHEDHNACEKTTATTASGNPLVCGYGYEIKNNKCVPTLVAGSIAGLERECEKQVGMEYNRNNGLCEKSKVPLTAEQLKQVEIDKCKDLQKDTNKAGSTTWVYCSDEGQPAYQSCVGKGFNADGTSSCNLKPVEFGNSQNLIVGGQVEFAGNGFGLEITENGQIKPTASVNTKPFVSSAVGCVGGATLGIIGGPLGMLTGCTVGATTAGIGTIIGGQENTEISGEFMGNGASISIADGEPSADLKINTQSIVGAGLGCVGGVLAGTVAGPVGMAGGCVVGATGAGLGILYGINNESSNTNSTIDDVSSNNANTGLYETVLDAPDAGVVDNLVGFGSGMATAGVALPVCTIAGLGNPVLVGGCEAVAFTGGALFGSKATDVVVNMLDN